VSFSLAAMIIETEIGLEKECARCHEMWPADEEFFYKRGDGLHCYCKACVAERCKELRSGYPRKIKKYTRKAANKQLQATR